MNELALFAGAGGGILGGKLLGWRTVCAVERDAYAAAVLAQRQNDGCLDPFPIWSDVETFDGKPWRGIVDIVSGGFPCQDISCAGKGAGITGARSGLWNQMARIVREVEPGFVFVENSPMLTKRGLGTILGDLAEIGFAAEWACFSGIDAGINQARERMWIVAFPNDRQRKNADFRQVGGRRNAGETKKNDSRGTILQGASSGVVRTANGVAYQLDRLKALFNGQIPQVAEMAFRTLEKRGRKRLGKPEHKAAA